MSILKVAKKLKISNEDLFLYGDDKAKIKYENFNHLKERANLVLVTAINPTKAGEGKTTVSIGLADALALKREKVCLALREPSLGPVFGMKGGATGGGKASIIPSEDIDLHFTGDFHAITSANNLLCAVIDNHIYQGNELDIQRVVFSRCLDMNDIVLKGNNKAKDRDEGFIITAASEIMAVLCNSLDMEDLKRRLGNIIVGFNSKEMPVYAKDLKVQNAMAKLLKDAINPNLVQTLEGTPAIVHLGPFANIAHGCNSIRATKLARRLSKWTITEAGFGADLGAEKFIDFKCRKYGLNPNAVVLVVTIKALKLHGEEENGGLTAIKIGFENARKHIDNIQKVWNKPCIVAINKFDGDTEEELAYVKSLCEKAGAKAEVVSVFQNGGKGAINLASLVMEVCSKQNTELKFAYNINDNIKTKCEDLAKNIYGAKKVIFSEQAKEDLKLIKKLKLDDLPIIVAKTQYSFSSDAKLVNAPKNFDFVIQRFEIRGGAEFIVAIAGDMLLMPALNKRPRAIKM